MKINLKKANKVVDTQIDLSIIRISSGEHRRKRKKKSSKNSSLTVKYLTDTKQI